MRLFNQLFRSTGFTVITQRITRKGWTESSKSFNTEEEALSFSRGVLSMGAGPGENVHTDIYQNSSWTRVFHDYI